MREWILPLAVLLLAAAAVTPGVVRGQTCTTGKSATRTTLSVEDIEKVVAYLVTEKGDDGIKVMNAGGYMTMETVAGKELTAAVIAAATEIPVTDADMPTIVDALRAHTEGAGGEVRRTTSTGASCATPAKASACTTANLCSEFGACSLYGDLATAQGETRDRYIREKLADGHLYEAFPLPAFEARDLDGETVHSESLSGDPTLLVFLAGHCGHSTRTLSTLQRLHRRYEPKGVTIVGMYVNTSSIATAKERAEQYKVAYELWTHPDDTLGEAVGSHLAPTALLIDASGNVRRKLVGEKSEKELATEIDHLLAGSFPAPENDLGLSVR